MKRLDGFFHETTYEGRGVTFSVDVTEEGKKQIRVTVDTDSHLGRNCVFNEVYPAGAGVDEVINDLHNQRLKELSEAVWKEFGEANAELVADNIIEARQERHGNIDFIIVSADEYANLGELEEVFEERGYDIYRKFFPNPKTQQFQSLASDEFAAVQKEEEK
jgi:hypothetical protein